MQEEIWKSITDYDGFYEVSNFGNVRSLDRWVWFQRPDCPYKRMVKGKVLRPHKVKNNYMVQLSNEMKIYKWFSISRLVALEFIPNPNNYPNVNHKDGNSLNNKLDNLGWGTELESQRVKQKNIRCVETGIIYANATIIQQELGYKASLIYQICKGRYKHAYGYHWEYVD